MPARIVAIVVIAAITALAGCSFVTMERVTERDRRQAMPTCTGSVLPIIADALGVMLWTGSIISSTETALDDSKTDEQQREGVYGALTFTGFALLHGASGYWGYHARERCKAARGAHERRLKELPRAVVPEERP